MNKRPTLNAALAGIAAKGDASRAAKSDPAIETKRDVSTEIPGAVEPAKPVAVKPLPKVTLYAHKDVLTAIRVLAAKDGVQAQEILRTAMREYLAKRGEVFLDLATGERA